MDQIAQDAYGLLTQSLTKAVETLTALLDNPDERLKRLAAKEYHGLGSFSQLA